MLQASRPAAEFESKQPRRLLLALGILLVALAAVIIRDHEFWFGADQSAMDGDGTASEVARPAPPVKTAPVAEAEKKTPAPVAKKAVSAVKQKLETAPVEPGVTATRTVLPPLDVEVVAGDHHRTVRPGSTVTNLEIKGAPSAFATNAADRERIGTADGVYEASYPLLSQHMNVQGSVVLQALIGADGVIESLRVVSGPSILTAAAQQAVRDWHFKPYLQNGTPVETKARITVNFSIKVADSSARS